MSDEGEVAGAIMGFLLVAAAVIAVIVFVIIPLFVGAMSIGAVYGSGNAVYNYGLAFRKNVKPERI